MADHTITHVSDTARWTSLHRATESQRRDALFHDPLAGLLAGEQGRAIVANVPRSTRNGWWLVARTKLIDDAVAEAVTNGCDRVLNLAAGLDTRPYRLELPAELGWVEADLPALLAEKTQLLADQTPRCRLTRTAVDLADPPARDAFLNDALDGAAKALVLTEGLLMYLDDGDGDGGDHPARGRLVDARLRRSWSEKDDEQEDGRHAGKCTVQIRPRNGVAYFEELGWRVAEVESLLIVAHRFRRLPVLMRLAAWLPQPDPRRPGTRPWSAATLLTH